MKDNMIPGLVIRLQSGFYAVETGQGIFSCRLRGRFKKLTVWEDIVAVGDRVSLTLLSDGTGVIEEVEPRHHALVRLDPRPRGDYKQIMLANPDQVVLVYACADPEPHLRMLDRFLIIAERQEIPPLIIANKVDLVDPDSAREFFSIYPPLGYRVLFTSTVTGEGMDEFRQAVQGKISALAGPSGVGKSSLLNAIEPNLKIEVNEISEAFKKGRHTTVVRQLYPLTNGGYVADMPGLRSLALWDIHPEELDAYFPELRDLVAKCQFSNCTHTDEPGCAVIQAVENGQIHPERYESYLRLRFADD